MVKAVRLRIFQQMPNYKKPASVVLKESFPLPPYSSVIGMVHSVCGFTEYHPMKISIQGSHASDVAEIEKQYVFGSIPSDRCDIVFPDSGNGVRSGMKTIHFLTDVNLCVHIIPEDETETEHIYNSFCSPCEYISLGRREDIARIDEVAVTELDEITKDNLNIKFNSSGIFCPKQYLEGIDLTGTVYKIPKVFGYENKGKTRVWKEIFEAVYTDVSTLKNKKKFLLGGNVYKDKCENACYIVVPI